MGIAERKERERRLREEMILDAAEKVCLEKGFKGATVDEIAEKAELSKGTIYLYFESKELILMGIELRGTNTLADYFTRAAASEDTGIGKVMSIGRAYYQFSQDFPCYFAAMSKFEEISPKLVSQLVQVPIVKECRESGMRVLEILADTIQIGIDDGTIRSDIDPMKTSVFLWAASNGVLQMHKYRAAQISTINGFSPDFLLEEFHKRIRTTLQPDSHQ